MLVRERIVIYVLLTALVEGCLVFGFVTLSNGLDLNNRTSMAYEVRQYLYYVSYNIGYVIYFPNGMEYGTVSSGFAALMTGCIGMLIAISITGEITVYARIKMRARKLQRAGLSLN